MSAIKLTKVSAMTLATDSAVFRITPQDLVLFESELNEVLEDSVEVTAGMCPSVVGSLVWIPM